MEQVEDHVKGQEYFVLQCRYAFLHAILKLYVCFYGWLDLNYVSVANSWVVIDWYSCSD